MRCVTNAKTFLVPCFFLWNLLTSPLAFLGGANSVRAVVVWSSSITQGLICCYLYKSCSSFFNKLHKKRRAAWWHKGRNCEALWPKYSSHAGCSVHKQMTHTYMADCCNLRIGNDLCVLCVLWGLAGSVCALSSKRKSGCEVFPSLYFGLYGRESTCMESL